MALMVRRRTALALAALALGLLTRCTPADDDQPYNPGGPSNRWNFTTDHLEWN